jgi:DNA-binding NtrC family response regulator
MNRHGKPPWGTSQRRRSFRSVGKIRPPRALVIDDEPLLRWSVAATLEEQGWQVTEAADVESAMAAFSEVAGAAGVVFLDPRWPDADGLQVLSNLHRVS